jgi:threonine/homoserine/homoserine lactone efflux protein
LGRAGLGGLAALGVGEFVMGQPILYKGLRWAGIAYLV